MDKPSVITQRKGIATLILINLIGFFACAYIMIPHNSTSEPLITMDGANVYLTIETTTCIYGISEHNLITDIGANQTSYAHGGTSLNCSWISIGNATASTSLTVLTTEYLREEVDSIVYGVSGSDYYRNVTKKFTFTETVNLDCAGWNWLSSGDNNLWAVVNYDAITFQANWNLTITWSQIFHRS